MSAPFAPRRRKPPCGTRLDRSNPLSRSLAFALAMADGTGAVAADSSGAGNAATLGGGASWAASPDGAGVRLDGSSGSLYVPPSPTLAWASGPFAAMARLAFAAAPGTSPVLWYGGTGAAPQFWVRQNTPTAVQWLVGGPTGYTLTTPTIAAGSVHTYLVSRDATGLATLYLDGVPLGTISGTGAVNGGQGLALGTRADLTTQFAAATYTAACGWNRSLSAGEAATLAADPWQVFEPPTAWRAALVPPAAARSPFFLATSGANASLTGSP